jgi:DNA-binding transcriptional LysR family regulator
MMEGTDLRRAAVFHAVATTGGITAAARLLGKSPPAVHADLRRFERDVGVALVERVGRGLRLTPKGRLLFETIGTALDAIDRTRSAVAASDSAAQPLRLGAVTGFGRYRLVPGLLPALPAARALRLRTGSHDDLLALLLADQVDFAVTYRPVVAAPIESLVVAQEDLVLVTRDTSPDPVTAALSGANPFVTYDEYEYVFARWFAETQGRQPPSLRRHDHFDELEEALASVATGRGATIAPADAAAAFGLTPVGPVCGNAIHLCSTRERLRSDDAAFLVACLKE